MFNTYKGARLDLQLYKGKAIIDYEIQVFNDDGTDFDLSVYDDIFIKIFEKKHGTLIYEYSIGSGIEDPTDNIISWSANDIIKRPKFYYMECYGILGSPEQEELIFHGVSEII